MKYFGYTEKDVFGNTNYTDKAMEFGKKIFETIHEATHKFDEDKDYHTNVEQIPGETADGRGLCDDPEIQRRGNQEIFRRRSP
jgi:anaerobic ribonucleoside-triphosphate reductase